ncbi:Syo1p [Sporobolomyces salmoneus]|uniref:Syo1p n=1 Tax=Sporobolomyces salmoneus TaxID=183962 RepID=UPI003172C5D7
MGKVRHRKRTRTARLDAVATPLTGADSTASTSTEKKPAGVQKKEQEITNLLDKLRSADTRERVWATSTLSSLLLSLPPVHLRLLLSRNLIGLLIERLTLPLPSAPSANGQPAAPNADELTVAVEALGTLRNLAVSSPPHILSEMHNKRLLLPLLGCHLPLLLAYLPTLLSPPQAPVKPSLPATPADRTAADLVNEANETLRRVYWDWAENVLVLLWCLAESNTKILGSLNAQGDKIVELIMAFLEEDKLGIAESAGINGGENEGGMEVDGKKKKQSKKDKEKGKKALRVPLFVAVAAAQTLHAFVSSNPAVNPHLLSSAGSQTFSPTLSSLLSILLTPTPSASPSSDSLEYWTQLRVLSFGILLELAKSKSKRRDVDEVRAVLKEEGGAKLVLMEMVQKAGEANKLESWVKDVAKFVGEIDPTAPTPPTPAPNSPQSRLNSLERQAQTLQLALEILSEYLASGLSTPGSSLSDDMNEGEDEEWGGISMDVEEGDLAMDEDEDAEVIVGQHVDDHLEGEDDSEMDGDEMLEDLENIVGDDSSDDEEEVASTPKITLTSLPLQLLALSQPTSLSFVPATSFSSTPEGADPSTGLISTSAAADTSSAPVLPAALSTLSEALTTIHVRAIEALNNLFVALSKAKKPYGRGKGKEKELQTVFEKVLEGMHAALTAQEGAKKVDKKPTTQGEEDVDEVEERREELVSASAGVVWGCTRLGLEEGGNLVVGPSTTPFLVQNVYGSSFASAATPQGEAIRVRALGALGCIGRRRDVPVEENAQIGQFLLSLLPSAPAKGAAAPPTNQSHLTPDALLQVVDSFIDLYADEEREYDVPNFRNGGMLPALEGSIAGVRAAIKKIDRKKFPELRLRADGALENMVAFVQYRKDILNPKPAKKR